MKNLFNVIKDTTNNCVTFCGKKCEERKERRAQKKFEKAERERLLREARLARISMKRANEATRDKAYQEEKMREYYKYIRSLRKISSFANFSDTLTLLSMADEMDSIDTNTITVSELIKAQMYLDRYGEVVAKKHVSKFLNALVSEENQVPVRETYSEWAALRSHHKKMVACIV